MNDYILEKKNNSFYIKIINIQPSKYGLAFLGGVGISMFLLPFIVTIFLIKGLSIGGMISWLLSWFISAFFLKLYLWNKYGEEIFIIKNNKLEVYNNYKIFKENHRYYQFTKINITFFVGTEAFFANEEVRNIDSNQLSEIGFQLDKDVVTSHKELSILKIIEIAKQIKNISNKESTK